MGFRTKGDIFQFIYDHQEEVAVTAMCEMFGVSPGGYYAWCARGPSDRSIRDAELLVEIRRVFKDSKERYGSPRVHAQLVREGLVVGERRIARIMRENGIRAIAENKNKAKPWKTTQYADAKSKIKDIKLTRVNQVWLTDITYLKINGSTQYMATVLDKYSRKILAWSIGPKKSCSLTKRVLKSAYRKRKPQGNPIVHSDRGSEFLGEEFTALVEELQMGQSVNRPKSMNDNAHMESWFKSMKTEMYHRRKFITLGSIRRAMYSYIEFYNNNRINSSLDYLTPCEYELGYAN